MRIHRPSLAIIFGIFFFAVAALPAAATDVRPAWSADFASPVAWQRVTAMGKLIISTGDGLHGIDPETGTINWTREDLAGLNRTGFQEIPGAPLFMIQDGKDNPRVVVLNANNGTLVFDSLQAGLVEIQGKYVMKKSGGLLIVGFEPGNFNTQLFMYDLATGKKRWHSEVLSQGMNKLTNLLIAVVQASMDVQTVHADPRELEDGSFLFTAMGAVQRIDAMTGNTLWKTKTGNTRVVHLTEHRPETLFVGSEEGDDQSPYYSTYQALDLETGNAIWKKPMRFRGALNPLMIATAEGLVISERTKGNGRIRLLDYDSGQSLWGKKGKGTKARGGIVDYDFTDAGMVVTTGFDSVWNDKGTEYLLYVLDPDSGESRFDKPLRVKGRMLESRLLDQGLLYVTTHEVNVFDPDSGALIHEPLVRSKRPIVTRWHDERLYAFNSSSGLLYQLDLDRGALTAVSTEPVKLEGKDEPVELDVRERSIALTGRQSVVGFDSNGEILFNAHHPAPKHHGLVQALMWAQAVRAVMASVDYGSAAVALSRASAETEEGTFAHELTSGLGDEFTQATEDLVGIAGDYAREARRRFQASRTARDFVFMMVRDEKKLALAQVSKQDGQIVSTIDLGRDKEPSYQVDDVSSRIFYQPAGSSIVAFEFAPVERVAVNR